MQSSTLNWLLASDEPWTRFRTRVDLLGEDPSSASAQQDYKAMIAHPQIKGLIKLAAAWPGPPLKRHNDASHPIHALTTLADFGIGPGAPGMDSVIRKVLAHQSPDGPFELLGNIPVAFGGSGRDEWHWMACDAPTLLYFLLSMLGPEHAQVQPAVSHLLGLAEDNGWRCRSDPALGKFKGPGRREDPCPIANVYALKALSLVSDEADSQAVQYGIEMLLSHWEQRTERKYFLFGMGNDFKKLKYPLIWYDIVHFMEVLSRFEAARRDPRLHEIADALFSQADADGRFQASSMYMAWKGWSFADKKNPSPWLTFVVEHIRQRLGDT